MLFLYRILTILGEPLISALLGRRVQQGKEESTRLPERHGITQKPRPDGKLVWIHAASVGESQSALILIDKIASQSPDTHFLVTTGTVTSAGLMAKRLPTNAIHQYYPFDRPAWVKNFLNHWSPDLALWMESELWPNMLLALEERGIPAALVNARLSDRSYARWIMFKGSANKILATFDVVLAQTDLDATRYKDLGVKNVIVTDNLKHCAAPLPYAQSDLENLQTTIGARPVWLYASTHAGEETLACRIHTRLSKDIPDLLTILVPRHPDRRDEIVTACHDGALTINLRGESKDLPTSETNIYIADTMGELGLFYRFAPIAVIGRCFSNDGGGGHNPIEAAQLQCVVLTGPNVQNQTRLFDEMIATNAAKKLKTEDELYKALKMLFSAPQEQQKLTEAATTYARTKENIINVVMKDIQPLLQAQKKKAA